jgi:hypothetical protein
MYATTLTTKRTTVALLAALLGGCDLPDSDDEGGGATSATPPTTGTLSSLCSDSPPLVPGATAQAIGAFCVGLALVGGDALGCVPTPLPDVTQCVDNATGSAYAVQWRSGVGTVVADQANIGTVQQRSLSRFDVALYDARTRRVEPAGQCTVSSTTLGQQARFCAYLAQ